MILCRFICLLLPLMFAGTAIAGDLYKCEGTKGEITISSEKCPDGTKQVWKRDAEPDPPLSPEEQAQAEEKRARDRANAHALSLMAGTSAPPQPPPPAAPPAPVPAAAAANPEGPCRKAHALEDGILANEWLDMRNDQLRRLHAWVAEQCQDPSR